MNFWEILKNFGGIGDKVLQVVIGERKVRVKRRLAKYRKLKEKMLELPPTFSRSRKVRLLNDKIKECITYLETAE